MHVFSLSQSGYPNSVSEHLGSSSSSSFDFNSPVIHSRVVVVEQGMGRRQWWWLQWLGIWDTTWETWFMLPALARFWLSMWGNNKAAQWVHTDYRDREGPQLL